MANTPIETDAILSSNWNEAGTLAQGVEKADGTSSRSFTFGLSATTISGQPNNEVTVGVKREDTDNLKDNDNSTSLIENGLSTTGLSGDELIRSLGSHRIKEEVLDETPFPDTQFSPSPALMALGAGFRSGDPVENPENLLQPAGKNPGAESRGRRGMMQHADSMRCLPPPSPSDSGMSSLDDENEKSNETKMAGNRQVVVTLVENLESVPSASIAVNSLAENNGDTAGEDGESDEDDGDIDEDSPVVSENVSLSDQIDVPSLHNAEEVSPHTNKNALGDGSQNGTKTTVTVPDTPTATMEKSGMGRRRGRQCPCDSCKIADCGKCMYCRDKPKFGGPNTLRQRCVKKEKCQLRQWKGGQGKKKYKKQPMKELQSEPRGRRSAASKGAPEILGSDASSLHDTTDQCLDDAKNDDDSYPALRRKRRRPPQSPTPSLDDAAESCLDNDPKTIDSSHVIKRRKGRPPRSSTSLLDDAADQCLSSSNPSEVETAEQSTLTQGICGFVNVQGENAESVDKVSVNPYLEGLPDAPQSEFYEEESAWRFHNPPLPISDSGAEYAESTPLLKLEPLPPAPPVPNLPQTQYCVWSFDDETRVLLANFRQPTGEVVISRDDEVFMLSMMERDDITVISEGLVDDLDPKKWDLDYIKGCSGDEFYHKFRGFQRICAFQNNKSKRKRKSQKMNGSESKGFKTEDITDSPQPDHENKRQVKIEENAGKSSLSSKTEKIDESDVSGDSGCQDRCIVSYKELDGYFTIKVSDYVRYLDMRHAALERIALHRTEAGRDPVNPIDEEDANFGRDSDTNEEGMEKQQTDVRSDEIFTYLDDDGETQSLNVVDVVLYMIDYDMVKLLPPLYEDFINKFKIPGCLPGGTHCMMNSVNVGGRPFMGPNLYLTPPGSFTHFHQDGHGTVDSGHQCLTGYNEVVMLRRLTERHKQHALQLLHGEGREHLLSDMQYDALYGLPHADGYGDRPMWPDNDSIDRCRAMNYYPSVFILKPGQYVHINKGRLHAFRKLSPTSLPDHDCHAKLRESIILNEHLGHHEQLCISVAWDWMFKGVTSEGTNREVVSILECARLNRKHMKQSLAIPETSLLHMVRNLISSIEGVKRPRLLQFGPDKNKQKECSSANVTECPFQPDPKTTLLGIFSSLEYVITRHVAALIEAEKKRNMASSLQRVSIGKRPNSWENPEMFSLDPYGNGDFFCKLCSEELSNVYMHCDGCEKILNKDFNICISCHSEERYKVRVQMHPLNPKRHSTINHTGDFKRLNQKRCPCKNGPACLNCTFCAGCSCKCHRWFTLHCRFFNISDEKILMSRAKALIPDELPKFVQETQARLASFNSTFERVQDAPNSDLKDALSSDLNIPQQNSSNGDSEMRGLQSVSSAQDMESQLESRNDVIHEPESSNVEVEDAIDVDSQVKSENHDSQNNSRMMRLERRNEKMNIERIMKLQESGSTSREEDAFDVDSEVTPENHDSQTHRRTMRLERRTEKLSRERISKLQESASVAGASCGKDWDHRCSTLIEDVPLPQCPTSKFDLSVAALAYTAPHGTLSKPMKRGGRIEGGLDADSLENFLREARELKNPTVEVLYSLLPSHCDVEKDHLRHLYRNFADSNEVVKGNSARNRHNAVMLSRRETDIISFFAANSLTPTECRRKLIPYRPLTTIHDIMIDIKRSKKYCSCSEYMTNVNKCVGTILELEECSSSSDEARTWNRSLSERQECETSEPVVTNNKTQIAIDLSDEGGQAQHQAMKEHDTSVDHSSNDFVSTSFGFLSEEERERLKRETPGYKDQNEVHL